MDVYGLGTALHYMIFGKPYNTQDVIEEEEQKETRTQIEQVLPNVLNLIDGMLFEDPNERFTLQ